ncbi:MAG TPA: hypothetical protein VF138_02440 [Caulobacteraceae bacterium]
MKRLLPLILLAACSQPAADPAPAEPQPLPAADAPAAPTPAPEPNSTEEAVVIARDYLTTQHPGEDIALGEPGRQEGAAGSIYLEVPAMIGDQAVTLVLRRVNDVPGSTPEQRRWHVERIDPK